jgi:hypothetical protein
VAVPGAGEELPPPRPEMDTTPALGRRGQRQRQTPEAAEPEVAEDAAGRPTTTRQWGSFLLAAGIGAALVFGVVRLTEGPATPDPIPSEASAVAPLPATPQSAAKPLGPVPLESIPVPLDSIPAEKAAASKEDETEAAEEKEATQPTTTANQPVSGTPKKAVPRRAAPQLTRKPRPKRPVAQPTRPAQPVRPPPPKPSPPRTSEGSGSSAIVREAPF